MIKLTPLFTKGFIVFFCIAINLQSQAQNCNCPQYYQFQTEHEQLGLDSKVFITKLEALPNNICKAKSYEWKAMDYMVAMSFDTANINLKKAEKLYQQSGCGDSIFLTTYKYWAQLYYTKGDFAKALEYSFKLLQSTEASSNPYETGICYTMISQLHNQMGQAEKGIIYARLAVPIIKGVAIPSQKADLLFKLSKRYLWHYQDVKAQSSLDSSERFSNQQLVIAKKINRYSSIAAAFNNLEGVAWEKEDYKTALRFLDSSFKYSDKTDIGNMAVNYFDKADLYIELKNYYEAQRMADSAMYYHKLGGGASYIADGYLLLSRIAVLRGHYKTAYENKELGREILDSIRNVEKTKEVTELEKKYSQATNEKTIKELAQQKRIYLLLALAGLLLLIVLIFFIRQQSLKNKQQIMETEQRLNRARMNPHFFFNALSSLQSFALLENDGKALASNLSKFSHIMRETLESTYKEYVTIEQESDFLEEYLGLQKIRFPQKFSYKIDIAENIEADAMLIPSMILQPFVENSIEHGFTRIDYPGIVSIHFTKDARKLHITITDNGKGLATTPKETSEHISRASQIIKDRIFLLNIKLKTRAGFSIDNNKIGQGVAVKIMLPVLHKSDVKNE